MRVSSFVLVALLSTSLVAANKQEANQALLAAAAEGEVDGLLAALKQGADANAKDDDGNTALMLVSKRPLFGHDAEVVNALKKAKATIDARNKLQQTALMFAAANDHSDTVKALIAAGAKVNAKDSDAWTPLMYAALNGASFATDELIKAKADLNALDSDGEPALLLALAYGKGSVAEKLVAAGAKWPDKSHDGYSPLMVATYGRDLKAVRIALDHSPDLGSRDKDGWSALELASYNGDGQIAMELLRAGIDPSLKDSEGKNAYDRAVENKNPEIAAILSGKWNKPKLVGGTSVNVPCPVLGGNVLAHITRDGDALVFTTVYPKPLTWYMGGGNMNRADSAKQYTYDGSIEPAYYFDSDANAKTGMTADDGDEAGVGADSTLKYSSYGTSVTLTWKDSKGEEHSKDVFANVLSADVLKGSESVDMSEVSDEDHPYASNDGGVLRTRVPLTLLGLKAGGKPVKMTAKIGSCAPVVAQVKLK